MDTRDPRTDEPPAAASLTERVVDRLAAHPDGVTTMQLALEIRSAYPDVQAELEGLEALGIVVRTARYRDTLWLLG
ncbi:MAG: hypothetical protein H6737_01480 [Alphaproteobacteria bacterium]|nr:hypothetical protein [Alphaproteobacteria bacterium]